MKFKMRHIVIIAGIPVLIFGFQNCSKLGTNGIAVDDKVLSLDAVEDVQPVASVPTTETVAPTEPSQPSNETDSEETPAAPAPSEPVAEEPAPTPSPAPEVQPEPSTTPVAEQPAPETSVPVEEPTKGPKDEPKKDVVDEDPVEVIPPVAGEPAEDVDDPEVADAIRTCNASTNLEVISDLKLKFNHENIAAAAEKISSLAGNWGGSVVVKAAKENAQADGIHVNHSTLVLCNFKSIKNIKGTFDKIVVVGGHVEAAQINNSTIALVNATSGEIKGAHAIIKRYSLK